MSCEQIVMSRSRTASVELQGKNKYSARNGLWAKPPTNE